MDLAIGIETRDEYLDLEVAKGAMTMVRDVLLVKPGRPCSLPRIHLRINVLQMRLQKLHMRLMLCR